MSREPTLVNRLPIRLKALSVLCAIFLVGGYFSTAHAKERILSTDPPGGVCVANCIEVVRPVAHRSLALVEVKGPTGQVLFTRTIKIPPGARLGSETPYDPYPPNPGRDAAMGRRPGKFGPSVTVSGGVYSASSQSSIYPLADGDVEVVTTTFIHFNNRLIDVKVTPTIVKNPSGQ